MQGCTLSKKLVATSSAAQSEFHSEVPRILVATARNSVSWDLCTPDIRVVYGWQNGTGAGFPLPVTHQ